MLKTTITILGAAVVAVALTLSIKTLVISGRGTETTTVVSMKADNSASVTPAIVNYNGTAFKEQKVVLLKPNNEKQLIIFNTPVVSETVQAAITRLEQLKAQGEKEAFIIFNSPGGSVFDGARLVAWILDSPMKVYTICDGLCASMAAHLFEVGKTRYMTNKSTLMFHPASGGVAGTLEQMASRLNYVQTYVDRLDANIAVRAGIDYKEFKRRTLTEYWVETEDAITQRLTDDVVFISYNRVSEQALNMEEHVRQIRKIIPEALRTPGVLITESIRLPDAK